jgi:hypothetical protein
MASQIDIVNRALSHLGELPIVSMSDNIKTARVMDELWDVTRDAFLQFYPWNFALKRASITADVSPPAWGYTNQYSLPNDFISLVDIKDSPYYTIEGSKILTDEGSPIYIRYIYKVTDTTLYPSTYVSALSLFLAFNAAEVLTQNSSLKSEMYNLYRENYLIAINQDASQNPARFYHNPDAWVIARY